VGFSIVTVPVVFAPPQPNCCRNPWNPWDLVAVYPNGGDGNSDSPRPFLTVRSHEWMDKADAALQK